MIEITKSRNDCKARITGSADDLYDELYVLLTAIEENEELADLFIKVVHARSNLMKR